MTNAELIQRLPGGSQKLGVLGEAWVEELLRCVNARWVVERTRFTSREMDLQVDGTSSVAGCDDFRCRIEVKHSGRVKTDPDVNKFERDIDVLIEQHGINAAVLVNVGGTIDRHISGEVVYRTRPDGLRIPILFLQEEGTSSDVFMHALNQLECLQRDSCIQFRCAASNGAELSRLSEEARRLREMFAAHGRSLDRRISSVTASIRGQQAELVELKKQKQHVQLALAPPGPASSQADPPPAVPELGADEPSLELDVTEPSLELEVDEPSASVTTPDPAGPSTPEDVRLAERALSAWHRFEQANDGRPPRKLGDLEGVDRLVVRRAGFRRIRDMVRHSNDA
jgi:uncharacterized protein YdcH (DUF465 family)